MTFLEQATSADFATIAKLNITAYSEYSSHVSPEAWQLWRERLTSIDIFARVAAFWVVREEGRIVGSVAMCGPGNADATIFPAKWAAMMLL
jgi:hypothetical protein